MKKKRWKLAGIFLMAALTVPSLGGCKVGNTQIRLSSGQLRNHNAIVRINDHKYDIRYAKLYLCNYRNLYGKAYGTDLWESYDADLEQYVKDVTIQELTHIACMDILAENQDMHLSEQEKKQAARAAKEYYQSLTEEEKTFIGLYEREIRTAYEEYALAEKLYHALTQGTDEEISDDEARVVRVQQIYVKEKEALRAVQENLAAGDDFASVASAYNQSREFYCIAIRILTQDPHKHRQFQQQERKSRRIRQHRHMTLQGKRASQKSETSPHQPHFLRHATGF